MVLDNSPGKIWISFYKISDNSWASKSLIPLPYILDILSLISSHFNWWTDFSSWPRNQECVRDKMRKLNRFIEIEWQDISLVKHCIKSISRTLNYTLRATFFFHFNCELVCVNVGTFNCDWSHQRQQCITVWRH